MFRLKVTAGDLLMRGRHEWGLKRKWEGNYLAQVKMVFMPSFPSSSFSFSSSLLCSPARTQGLSLEILAFVMVLDMVLVVTFRSMCLGVGFFKFCVHH